jgi:hypothetical protein
MNVYYLSLIDDTPCNDYWDYGFINDFIAGKVWQPANFPDFETSEVRSLPKDDAALVLLPARHHKGYEMAVNSELNKIDHVVLFLMGDEEADFDIEAIKHPSIQIWVQNPHPGKHDAYNKLGTGYPPQLKDHIPKAPRKELNVFFSGQVTHKRRIQLVNNLNEYELRDSNTLVNATKSFTAGFDHSTYYQHMSRAKVAPCPSGAVIPDSFRAFEALECMAIPIADEVNPDNTITFYWNWLFGEETAFPKIAAYDRLVGLIQETLDDWPRNMHQQTAWWIAQKRQFAMKVCDQLEGKDV